MELNKISEKIREVLSDKRKQMGLTFEEDTHTYTMKDLKGKLRNDWPSVSKVMKLFYDEFPANEVAEKKAQGDPVEKQRLLDEWAKSGTYSTNMGSRVHYLLEKKTLEMFGLEKEVRQPIFECDFTQILKGDSMITAGTNYLKLLKERNAVLLDTEMVLGHPNLGYTGQPDKVWLIENKEKNGFGIFISDWKSNKPKNFEVNQFTKKMKPPFHNLPDNALGHYYTQLPFYGKLLVEMLKGTEFENLKVYGCIVTLLKEDGTFEEFRVPKDTLNTIMTMDIKQYLTKKGK